jgi:hypothetical protein
LYTSQIPEVHHHLHPYDHCRLSGHRPAGQLPGKPLSDFFFSGLKTKEFATSWVELARLNGKSTHQFLASFASGKILKSGPREKAMIRVSYAQQLSQFDTFTYGTTEAGKLACK